MASNDSQIEEHEILTHEECEAQFEANEYFFRYIQYTYCDFNNNFSAAGLMIYLAFLIILFITIGTAVDKFFCRCLAMLSSMLNMSQNVAGVTLLAFGNGAPEIFSSIVGAKFHRSKLVIAGLFGSGMFLTCVVAGTIMLIMPPFEMVAKPFLRDVIFYLMVGFWTYTCLYYQRMTFVMALSFCAVYVLYTIYVIVAHNIFQKYFQSKSEHYPFLGTRDYTSEKGETSILATPNSSKFNVEDLPLELSTSISVEIDKEQIGAHGTHDPHEPKHIDQEDESAPWNAPPIIRDWDSVDTHLTDIIDDFDLFLKVSSKTDDDIATHFTVEGIQDDQDDGKGPFTSSNEKQPVISSDNSRINIDLSSTVEVPSTLMLFFLGICPVNYHLWSEAKWWNKTLQILRAPVVFVLKLTIPLKTFDHVHHNWCRPLNALHCIITPLFLLFAFRGGFVDVYGPVQLWMLILLMSSICAICTLVFTINSKPPSFHGLWSFLGFAASIGWMYLIAKEIVVLLTTFGKILNLSDEILGLTILSWGNGIPDFIADVSISRKDLPQMGISACYGGPLIILLLGIGIPFTISTASIENHEVEVLYTKMTTIFSSFLCASLISSLIIVPVMQFKTHKFFGVYLLFLYALFLLTVILHESHIV